MKLIKKQNKGLKEQWYTYIEDWLHLNSIKHTPELIEKIEKFVDNIDTYNKAVNLSEDKLMAKKLVNSRKSYYT